MYFSSHGSSHTCTPQNAPNRTIQALLPLSPFQKNLLSEEHRSVAVGKNNTLQVRSLSKDEGIVQLKDTKQNKTFDQHLEQTEQMKELDTDYDTVEYSMKSSICMGSDNRNHERNSRQNAENNHTCRHEFPNCQNRADPDSDTSDDEAFDVSDEIKVISTRERIESSLYMARITKSGVILWKKSMAEIDDLSEDAKMGVMPCRIPCLSYRALLPPNVDKQPVRSPKWLRRCMRAILHVAIRRHCNENTCGGVTFPALVYSWFEPNCPKVVENCAHDAQERRNADRWGLYHGVKFLQRSDAEALLFFRLLDEFGGEDFLRFSLSILREVDKMSKGTITKQFGLKAIQTTPGYFSSIDCLKEALSNIGGDVSALNDDNGGAEAILLPLDVANQIVLRLIPTLDQSSSLLEKTENMAFSRSTNAFDANKSSFTENETEIRCDFRSTEAVQEEYSTGMNSMFVGLYEWLHLILELYDTDVNHFQRAARLMFDTAATGALIGYTEQENTECSSPITNDCRVDFRQFQAILSVLRPGVSTEEAAVLFQESYDNEFPPSKQRNEPALGISFDSFIVAANRRRFFSKSQVFPFLSNKKT